MGKEKIRPPQPGFKPKYHGMLEADDSDFTDGVLFDPLTIAPNSLESQCGMTNESQDVEQYNGNLGITRAFVDANQASVGQLQWNNNLAGIFTAPGNVNDVRWCSGTLIARDLFLSAGHCFDSDPIGWILPMINGTSTIIAPADIALNMHVNFNFQRDPMGNQRQEQQFAITQLVEHRLGGLDYAIVRLAGNPGDIFGVTPLSGRDATVGEMSAIIGHPAGLPKQVEAGPITSVTDNEIRYNDTDTLGGNSGSAVLLTVDGTIAGVHTNGGCAGTNPETGFNIGQRMGALQAVSPTLNNLVIEKTPGFDAPFYLATYPDLEAAFGSNYRAALDHWINQGLPNEGRRGSREFDARFYLAAYPDIQAAFGNDFRAALDHWASQGLPNEGRRGAREFDVQYYLAAYADIQAAFGTNYQAAMDHWSSQGLPHEGRRGSRSFDVRFYLATYPDLQNAFGNNFRSAVSHWVRQGLPNEGRCGSRDADVQFYLAVYPDLQAAFGTNYQSAVDHWEIQGLPNEGRRASREFDPQFYLATYPDLQAAFNINYRASFDHWVTQGLPQEGRRGSREFDVQFYLAAYADLQNAFGANFLASIDHWIHQGLPNEGRRGSISFDVQFYLATYPDLQAAFGSNYRAAFNHWVSNGMAEGRTGVA